MADRLQYRPPARRRAAAPGTDVSRPEPIGVRDKYTIAGLARRKRRARPHQPAGRRDRDVRPLCPRRPLAPGRRPRAITGRAARRSPPGGFAEANRYFQRAAAYPELFYGQLALERLGRSVPPPAAELPTLRRDRRRSAPPSRQPAGPGGAPARPAGQRDRAGPVRPRARRIARQRRRPNARGRARPADRPPGPAGVGRADRRATRARASTSARPSRSLLGARCRAGCGRWPTASRRQESSFDPMRSATPARAA